MGESGGSESRTEAKKKCSGRDIVEELRDMGTEIMAHGMRTIAEEMPHAYKDVSEVVQVMHDEGISLKVAKLKPMGVIKG